MLTAVFFMAKAQDMPIFGQNYINRFSVNPAFAGYNGNTEAFVGYRQSMVGIDGANKTMAVDLNGAANENMGYGVSILNQKSGNFNNLFASVTYAYHIKMSDDMSLSLALSPAVVRNAYNIAGATTYGNAVDPVLQNQAGLSATGFDAGFGLMFNWTNLFVSVSLPRLICKDLDFNPAIYNYDRSINAEISYILETGDFEIEPLADLWYGMKGGVDYRVSVAAKYKKRFWAMLSYMNEGYIGVGMGAAAGSRIVVNYQYEVGTTDLSKNVLGTHEISVGFLVSRAKKRKLPTIFPDDENAVKPEDNKKDDKLLQETIKKLNQEVEDREKEIERLENMIKALPQNSQSNNQNSSNNQTSEQNNNNQSNNGSQETAQQQQENQPQNNEPQQQEVIVENPKGGVTDEDNRDFPGLPESSLKGPVTMWNVSFGYGSAKLQSSTKVALEQCCENIKRDGLKVVQVVAHYDAVGSEKYNLRVAKMRLKTIEDFFVEHGVTAQFVPKTVKYSKTTSHTERLAQNMFEYYYIK